MASQQHATALHWRGGGLQALSASLPSLTTSPTSLWERTRKGG